MGAATVVPPSGTMDPRPMLPGSDAAPKAPRRQGEIAMAIDTVRPRSRRALLARGSRSRRIPDRPRPVAGRTLTARQVLDAGDGAILHGSGAVPARLTGFRPEQPDSAERARPSPGLPGLVGSR